jgi:type IV fimbrial biogenesis protein FimT
MLELRYSRGYNLLELLVTLAIVAILASIAAPSFSVFIENQRVRSAANDLMATMNLARSEAVTRNASITVSEATGGWSNGWIVKAGATVLQSDDSVGGVVITGSVSSFSYNSSARASVAATFALVPSSGNASRSRCVSISLNGKPNSKSGGC